MAVSLENPVLLSAKITVTISERIATPLPIPSYNLTAAWLGVKRKNSQLQVQ